MQDLSSSLPTFSTSTFYYLLGLSVFISCFGLFIPIMEVDASQYASMSLELWQSHSLLQLTDLGEAYLDKPPLLFWLAGLSIHILGNSSFAFKLPSFLFAWGSVYALYRFTILYYPISIARLSALVYACSVAFLLFTNDIRTDTLMIALVVFSVWQLGEFLQKNKVIALYLATGFIALAMLAKGPIGLVVPCLAFGPNILLKRQWKSFIRWEIIFIPLILLLILSPMLIGLHQQWGMHGLIFFFWEQSFGGKLLEAKFWRQSFGGKISVAKFWRQRFGGKVLPGESFCGEGPRIWENKWETLDLQKIHRLLPSKNNLVLK